MTQHQAQYNDGQSAAAVPISVRPGANALILEDGDGGTIARWPWADIRLIEQVTDGRPVRLSNRSAPGARLTFDDPAVLSVLEVRAPYLHRDPINAARLSTIAGILGVCAVVVAFFIYGLPILARPLAALVPVAWEERIGQQTIDIVNSLFADGRKACESPDGTRALNALTQRLTATVQTPYTVRVSVADSAIVNAFAVPGGRIVLFRGLLEKAQSAEEVAGVLAHELAHVVHRHPTRSLVTSAGWSALLSAFTGGASLSNEVMAQLAVHLATSASTRELESDADAEAVASLNAAGIGSDGLIEFFESLELIEAKGIQLPEYLASHPITQNRIAAIERMPRTAAGPAMSEADWQALRTICG